MKGIVYRAPGDMAVETVPDPSIVEPSDALVRVTKAAICGSDLHIFNHGEAFGFTPGCRVGHEFVGEVVEVGRDVSTVAVGDRVVSPFWYSCGTCHFCRRGVNTCCVSGGAYGFQPFWSAGGEVQGGQSQFVRVPHADGTLERLPEALAAEENDLKTLAMADVFTTAYHAAVAARPEAGGVTVVIGDGAVGLLGAHAATLFDQREIILLGHHDDRLAIGEQLGATRTINTTTEDAAEVIAGLTDGLGPEAVVSSITNAETMGLAMDVIQGGGGIGWVGMEVFLGGADVPLDRGFAKNVSIGGGMANVKSHLPRLLPMLAEGRIDPSPVFTHDLPMDEAAGGYPIMNSRQEGSVKVAITP